MPNLSIQGITQEDAGTLLELLIRNHPGTVKHIHQVLKGQLEHDYNRGVQHYTADTSAYETIRNTSVWYFGEGHTSSIDLSRRVLINPVFNHIQQAYGALNTPPGNFIVPEDSASIVRSHIKDPIELRALNLQTNNDTFGYFEVPTDKHARIHMNQEQLYATKWAIAGGKDLDEVLAQREEAEKRKFSMQIYSLTSDFVLFHVPEGNMIARACMLYMFSLQSRIDAHYHFVNDIDSMRGIRLAGVAKSVSHEIDYASLADLLGAPTLETGKLAYELKSRPNAIKNAHDALGELMLSKSNTS